MFLSLAPSLGAQSWSNFKLQAGCSIHHMNGEKLKTFPGSECIFFDDGSYVTASHNGGRYLPSPAEHNF